MIPVIAMIPRAQHTSWRWIGGAILLVFAWIVWQARIEASSPVRWADALPPISRTGDTFTVKVIELDPEGRPKAPQQLTQLMEAAKRADDIFVFIHGWRRDAEDLSAMEAFLSIYRQAFDCLATRDIEGTAACAATHDYCHAKGPETKLVVLVLWDAKTGLLGFRRGQRRAVAIGEQGLLPLLRNLHKAVQGRGTLLAFAHSLGASALAASLRKASDEGPLPLDGALLVMGAFPSTLLEPVTQLSEMKAQDVVLLNLYNPKDGYLWLYERVYGDRPAGEWGLHAVPSSDGMTWEKEGSDCGGRGTFVRASLLDQSQTLRLAKGATVEALNLDISTLVKGHQDTEALAAIRLYNRAVAETLFRILWNRAFPGTPDTALHPKIKDGTPPSHTEH